jgi:gluconolactonase
MRLNLISIFLLAAAVCAGEDYKPGPDSQRHEGVPKGAVTKYSWTTSKLFPGTVRDYWVYVPAQYKGDKPACLMVFFDGGGFANETGAWRAPVVMDNLIHKGEMPVTIGIFINPGVMPALTANQQARYNRSYEYDAIGDRNARFLIEEIIPEVAKQYRLSSNPDDRALAGSSSGGIAAFVAAWNRPDAFHRVLSFVGSFTNLRGGQELSSLIRKTEPKPLRVHLQDGSNDQNIYGGNWFIGNQDMYSALDFAGYDVKFTIGTEGHNSKHGSAILPETLRWLWRGYPTPIAKPTKVNARGVADFVDLSTGWELVSDGFGFTEGPAVDKHGNVFFTDLGRSKIFKIGLDGKVALFKDDTGGVNGLMFGPDGRLYGCQNKRKRIVAYTMDGAEAVVAEGTGSNDIAITAKNEIYYTDPGGKKVWFIDAKGNKRVVHEGIGFPNGVRLSPDQALLLVADYSSRWVWSFQIQPDGSLANGQAFYRLEMPDELTTAAADGMTLDSEGYLYVATNTGIQICDPPGRVVAILSKPQLNAALTNAVFGGPGLDQLFVTNGDKVYRRPMKHKGVNAWTVVKPPAPRM